MADNSGRERKDSGTPNDVQAGFNWGGKSFQLTTRKAFEAVIVSAQSLAVDPTLHDVFDRIEQIPNLEKTIGRKDEQLKQLEAKIQQNESRYKTTQQEVLNTYNADRENLRAAVDDAQGQLTALREQLTENKTLIASLEKAKTGLRERIQRLEGSVRSHNDNAEQAQRTIKELSDAVKTERDTNFKAERGSSRERSLDSYYPSRYGRVAEDT